MRDLKLKVENSRVGVYGRYLWAHPLFAGSAVMIVGNNFVNFGNYIYHLLMGRLLGPASYGDLAAILSIIGILGMIPFSLGLVVVKFVSSAGKKEAISGLATWVERRAFLVGFAVGGGFLVATPFIRSFLQVQDARAVAVVAPLFLLSVVTYFNSSSLQGLMRFGRLVSVRVVEVASKVLIGTALVFMGFSVLGALGGMVLGGVLAVLLTHMYLRDHLGSKEKQPDLGPLIKYAAPVLLMSIATTSLYSTDLVLVKHFFDSHDAGIYASLSMLGRIIFFGAGPIGAVMFPLVSQRQSRGQNYQKIFFYSLVLTSALALVVLTVYWVFPKLAINLLYGSLYLEAAGLLVWFGLFMTLFTLSSLLVSYHLSLGQVSVVVLPLAAAVFQGMGIWLVHDSLFNVIKISIVAAGLLLGSLLLYFGYATAKQKGS